MNSQQAFAEMLLQTPEGRKVIAIACRQSLGRIDNNIGQWFYAEAMKKLAEIVDERDRAAKAALMGDRATMDPIRKLRTECPPSTQMEITQDVASFFGIPLRQAEALLYVPSAPETRQQQNIPAPRRLGQGQ